MAEKFLGGGLKRMWKETVVVYFKVFFQHFRAGTE
jgi:hypothetical protein